MGGEALEGGEVAGLGGLGGVEPGDPIAADAEGDPVLVGAADPGLPADCLTARLKRS